MAAPYKTAFFRGGFVDFSEANLSIASAPVLYGLSVYTVFPVFYDQNTKKLGVFRLQDHFKRLQNSSKILAFDDFLKDWDYKKFEETMLQLLKDNHVAGDSLVRVTIFVDDILKGTRMSGLKHSLSAFVYPAEPLLPLSGARLAVSSWRRTPDNAIPARAKINGSYVNAALMKHEAVANGYDDAVALDEHGHVTESTVSNLFLVRDGILITPSRSSDLLEGITRDSVFKFAKYLDINYEARVVDRSELYLAQEMFLCGSSMNIVPVISVDGRKIGDGKQGPITQKLVEAYHNTVRGQSNKFDDWITTVA